MNSNPLNQKSGFIAFYYFFLTTLILLPNLVQAQGDLLVMPKRVVFEGSKRSEILNLANIGNDTAFYTISFMQIKMLEDGSFEAITEPETGQQFADDYIRVFPRKVTLAPNESQTVKLQITKTNELKQGEYRSHLYFRAAPKTVPLSELEQQTSSSIAISLIPVYGISIPTIIRAGQTSVQTHISDIKLVADKDSTSDVQFTINRKGNISIYGDISVDHISDQGKVSRVATVAGVAVYTPNSLRRMTLKLGPSDDIDLSKGKLVIAYSPQNVSKTEKYAEAEILLNKVK
jgi:hypothetical protein